MPLGADADADGPETDGEGGDQRGEPQGAILPLFAFLLVVLIGVTGFAVDLGWMYFKSIEVQHGADLSSLAGVVYEPMQRVKAHDEALAAAKENGFVDKTLGGPDSVLVEDFVDNPAAVEHSSQLRVTIRHQIPTFFIRIFGINEIHITRTAVAQYIQPLAMGSPLSTFGVDPASGHNPGFWGSVHGTFGPQGWGDRYAALCLGNTSTPGAWDPGCAQTPEARPSIGPGTGGATGGYVYGIEVTDDSGLAVEIFDGPYYHYQDEAPVGNASLYFTGDYAEDVWGTPTGTTWFMLYGPDETPLDTSDNALLCTVRYDGRDSRIEDYPWWDPTWTSFADVTPASNLDLMWDSMATSPDATSCAVSFERGSGVYPLRVMVDHDNSNWITNKYSLRVSSTSGSQPTVYGLGDMSIFANFDRSSSFFHIARVLDQYAGKTLLIELWDAGDVDVPGSVTDTLTIASGNGDPMSCSWTATNGNNGSSCTIDISARRFNNELVTITIPIPETYACSGLSCWFTATYSYAGSDEVHDTTTWSAFIVGNPIRLVE